ncbi:MAG: cbb3-type cytochrome c oxidase subunit 3 [Dehalogenimonas sp.]
MDEATLAQTILTAWLFIVFLGFLIWGIRSGQFKNVEEAKYQMFKHQKIIERDPSKDGQKK